MPFSQPASTQHTRWHLNKQNSSNTVIHGDHLISVTAAIRKLRMKNEVANFCSPHSRFLRSRKIGAPSRHTLCWFKSTLPLWWRRCSSKVSEPNLGCGSGPRNNSFLLVTLVLQGDYMCHVKALPFLKREKFSFQTFTGCQKGRQVTKKIWEV